MRLELTASVFANTRSVTFANINKNKGPVHYDQSSSSRYSTSSTATSVLERMMMKMRRARVVMRDERKETARVTLEDERVD